MKIRYSLALGVVVAAALVARTSAAPAGRTADESAPTKGVAAESADHVARQTWAIMDLVASRHIDPPTRQEMVLGAVRALVQTSRKARPPYHLSERASGVTSLEPYRHLVSEFWPSTTDASTGHKLYVSMVEGLLAAAPGNASLIPADQVRVQNQVSSSRYVGIGIEYQHNREANMPQVVTPFRRGPAHLAGVKPGDLLVAIDGKKTLGIDLAETASWVRGPEGTPVTIVFRQPDSKVERTIRIVRGVIPIETVQGFQRSGDDWAFKVDPELPIGYLAINALHSSTLHELRQAEAKLKATGVRALVLDFRLLQNGTPEHQAEVVGASLLGGGLLWRVHDAQDQVRECRSTDECLFRGWPIAILMSEDTSDSMAQALAAALHDGTRAILVGEGVRSDPYVMTQVDLPDGLGAAMLRTARLERAADTGWPLAPDRMVEATPVQRAQVQKWLFDKQMTQLPPGSADRPPEDPQLAKAMEALKQALNKSNAGQVRGGR